MQFVHNLSSVVNLSGCVQLMQVTDSTNRKRVSILIFPFVHRRGLRLRRQCSDRPVGATLVPSIDLSLAQLVLVFIYQEPLYWFSFVV